MFFYLLIEKQKTAFVFINSRSTTGTTDKNKGPVANWLMQNNIRIIYIHI